MSDSDIYKPLWDHVIAQFPLGIDSIHGPSHWKRVESNGLKLAGRTGANPVIVRLFAVFHDSRRMNDFTDPGHGGRGAELAAELRGKFFELEDKEFSILQFACVWHTDKDFSPDPTIGSCWDADRLDLGRVGIVPSASLMSTEFGKEVAKAGSFYSFEPGNSER